MTVAIRLGWVRIYTRDPPLLVRARLGEERPTVESGYGGWEEVERPRRKPLTTFKASPALRFTLPILLDNFVDGRSIETDLTRLERMALPLASDGEPPRVWIAAKGGAIPYQGRAWVIESIAWGDALMNNNGNRTRQAATLSLLEYVEDVHLTEKSAAQRRRSKSQASKSKKGAPSKRITAGRKHAKAPGPGRSTDPADDFGQGEDLASIAARVLGDAERWPEIAELNGIRDPRSIRPGQVLRLP